MNWCGKTCNGDKSVGIAELKKSKVIDMDKKTSEALGDNSENGSRDEREKLSEINLVVKISWKKWQKKTISIGDVSKNAIPIDNDNSESSDGFDETGDNYGKTEKTSIFQYSIIANVITRGDRVKKKKNQCL